ncbi:MAG TPA: CRTAC1 family protein [Planctomycetaceae bacterium]
MPEGAAFVHRNGEESGQASILEIVGGGVAIFDYDADGQLDLFFPGGGRFGAGRELVPLPGALLRNAGDWRFARHEGEAGLNSPRRYNHGTAVGDHDNDGFPDLLITGYGGLQLYLNAGDGTYRDRTREARLDDPLWSTSAAWGDFNGDGNLDLFVVHYVDWSFDNDPFCPAFDGRRRERCTPQRYGPLPESLYLSRGDGTFADASQNSGLRRDGKGLGVVLADVDLDGDLDIYVANDTVQNFLYCNDAHAHFEELGSAWGAAFNDRGAPDGSMGVAVTDYNLDGLPDLWVANYEGETIALYKNLGAAGFEHVSQRTGVAAVSDLAVGFGTLFFDADRDGDDDAVVVNGHVLLFPKNAPRRQLPLLFENLAGKKLVNVAPQAGDYFCANHMGRGLARGDLDGDGDIDLAVAHLNEPIALLENTTADPDAWLAVRLIGTTSNRDAVGARVTLHTSPAEKSSNVQSRQVTSGDSYLSHSDRMLFWGVPRDISRDISGDISGGQTAASLVIHWPSGRTQTISNLSLNRRLTIVEPD